MRILVYILFMQMTDIYAFFIRVLVYTRFYFSVMNSISILSADSVDTATHAPVSCARSFPGSPPPFILRRGFFYSFSAVLSAPSVLSPRMTTSHLHCATRIFHSHPINMKLCRNYDLGFKIYTEIFSFAAIKPG
jgi:hypothetical protein